MQKHVSSHPGLGLEVLLHDVGGVAVADEDGGHDGVVAVAAHGQEAVGVEVEDDGGAVVGGGGRGDLLLEVAAAVSGKVKKRGHLRGFTAEMA